MNSLPRKLEPGDAIHYISMLDERGDVLATIALDEPLEIDVDANAERIRIEPHIQIYISYEKHSKVR